MGCYKTVQSFSEPAHSLSGYCVLHANITIACSPKACVVLSLSAEAKQQNISSPVHHGFRVSCLPGKELLFKQSQGISYQARPGLK